MIIGRVQAGPYSTPYWCLETLFVGCAGESPPGWRSMQQLTENNGLVNMPQRAVAHAVIAQQFHSNTAVFEFHGSQSMPSLLTYFHYPEKLGYRLQRTPHSFLPARRYASAGLCDSDVSVRLSVCLSVRHTPVLCLAERKQDREMYTIW